MQLLEQGRVAEAVPALDEAARLAGLLPDPEAEANLLFFKAQTLLHLGEAGEALAAVERSLERGRPFFSPPQRLTLQLRQGETLLLLGRTPEAQELLAQVQGEAAQLGLAPLVALAALQRCRALQALGRWTEAIEVSAGLLELARRDGVRDLAAAAALELGESLGHNGNGQEAREVLREGLSAIDGLPAAAGEDPGAAGDPGSPLDPLELKRALLLRLAWASLEEGDREEARDYLERHEELGEPGSPTSQALVLLIGALVLAEATPAARVEQLEEARRLADAEGPTPLQLTIRLLLARHGEDPGRRQALLDEAEALAAAPSLAAYRPRLALGRAALLLQAGDLAAVGALLARLDPEQLGSPGLVAELRRLRATTSLRQGQLHEALVEALDSLELYRKLDQTEQLVLGHLLVAMILRGLGKAELALAHLEDARESCDPARSALLLRLAVERAWLWLAVGQSERAAAELAPVGRWAGLGEEPGLWREYALCWASASRAQEQPGPALDLLREVVATSPGGPLEEFYLRLAILDLERRLGLPTAPTEARVQVLGARLALPVFDPLHAGRPTAWSLGAASRGLPE
jgi:tetratricopeptide (TPR) repeat protein